MWLQVTRGAAFEIPYTIVVKRDPPQSVGTLSFTINCPGPPQGYVVTDQAGTQIAAGTTDTAGNAVIQGYRWPIAPDAAANNPQGQISLTCGGGPPTIATVTFTTGNTNSIRETATLKNDIIWPAWDRYFPAGGWLTTVPTTRAVARSTSMPSGSMSIKEDTTFEWTYVVENTLLCFSGATVRAALLKKPAAGRRTWCTPTHPRACCSVPVMPAAVPAGTLHKLARHGTKPCSFRQDVR